MVLLLVIIVLIRIDFYKLYSYNFKDWEKKEVIFLVDTKRYSGSSKEYVKKDEK